uniref:Ubiquitin carboxyl-terminal hydrolase MINDY n=1 Tax=Naja naja TaxID=35670 RepID=A0A8C6XI33_NAJNA
MAELEEMIPLVWGKKTSHGLAETIFCRWTQGFVFSDSESTALEQFEGGPCAVIAPVQAFLLKKLFTCEKSTWRQSQEEEQKNLLCHALCEILEMTCSDQSESYCLATWQRGNPVEETAHVSESSDCLIWFSRSFCPLFLIFFINILSLGYSIYIVDILTELDWVQISQVTHYCINFFLKNQDNL